MLGAFTSLAEIIEEAVPFHEALKNLYEGLNDALESDPPPKGIWQEQRSSRESGKMRHRESQKVHCEDLKRLSRKNST